LNVINLIITPSFDENKCLSGRAFDYGLKSRFAPPQPARSGIRFEGKRRERNPIPFQSACGSAVHSSACRLGATRATRRLLLQKQFEKDAFKLFNLKHLLCIAAEPYFRFPVPITLKSRGQRNPARLPGRSLNEEVGRCITPWRSVASLTPSVERPLPAPAGNGSLFKSSLSPYGVSELLITHRRMRLNRIAAHKFDYF
jgi:hypothetical protein